MARPRKKKEPSATRQPRRQKASAPAPRGLTAREVGEEAISPGIEEALRALEAAGGTCLARFRDPFGGHPLLLASLPIESVQPTPYQRDLSDAHVRRLATVVSKVGRFLDPLVAVPAASGGFHTPNGHHRLAAMRALGARAVTALVLPEKEIAFQILALNTEKAHNLRERSLEVIRMARDLARLDERPESAWAFELEDATLVTLGICYERRPRFSGGAYAPALRRADDFLEMPLARALEERERRASRIEELDDLVAGCIAQLKGRGFDSPYMRPFVVARCNPLRFRRGARMEFDDLVEKMIEAARRFDASKVKAEDISASAGPPPGD